MIGALLGKTEIILYKKGTCYFWSCSVLDGKSKRETVKKQFFKDLGTIRKKKFNKIIIINVCDERSLTLTQKKISIILLFYYY